MLRPSQIRAARALLGISQGELADRAEVGVATVRRLEGQTEQVRGTAQVLLRIQKALEAAGVTFLEQDGKVGPGVRHKRPID